MSGRRLRLFRLMRETGIRVGDAIALKGTSFVRGEDDSPYVELVAQKTGKALRAPVSETTYKTCASFGAKWCFPSERDSSKHISRSTAWRWIKESARRAGLDPSGISPHSLRKCFAVDVLHRDGLEAVRKALQHSNDAVTRVYAYADTVGNKDSDEPIRWRDLDMICDYLLDRLKDSGYNGSRSNLKGDVPKS